MQAIVDEAVALVGNVVRGFVISVPSPQLLSSRTILTAVLLAVVCGGMALLLMGVGWLVTLPMRLLNYFYLFPRFVINVCEYAAYRAAGLPSSLTWLLVLLLRPAGLFGREEG